MRELPRAAVAYLAAVVLLGTIVLLRLIPEPPSSAFLAEFAVFAALAVVADINQLVLNYEATHSVATAINFAAVIVFGPGTATWIAAASSALADIWKRKPLYKIAFNAALIGTSVAAGAAAFEALRVSPQGQLAPRDLPAVAAYAVVNLLVNHALLCIMIGLATRTRPIDVALANYRGVFVPMVALFPLGVLMAVTFIFFGRVLGLVLLVIPTVAVYNALDRAQQLRHHTRAALEALADTVDRRDHYTAEHSRRVADYAEQICSVLRLSLAERQTVVAAARVHDLGKISTPDAILRKQGPLDDEEWEVMRSHPQAGAAILVKLPMYEQHAALIGAHHERVDGAGYPGRLEGTALPRGAAILAVADAFDAMTSDRPYRAGVAPATAIARLRAASGTQFSPEAVEALATALGFGRATSSADQATAAQVSG